MYMQFTQSSLQKRLGEKPNLSFGYKWASLILNPYFSFCFTNKSLVTSDSKYWNGAMQLSL